MKKYKFFPLWEIESLEYFLEEMELKGYRLNSIRCSYFFSFKESSPKEMHYFLSYKSFRGANMGHCDYALESEHNANPIESKMCYYSLYRTKEPKSKLSLLYEVRLDYIKRILLEKVLTALFIMILFLLFLLAEINSQITHKSFYILWVFVGICACLTIYYLIGFFKQKTKCKKYERENK